MKLNVVPASTGMLWVKEDIRAFWRRPLALASIFLLTTLSISLTSLVPFIGPALALALLPFATLTMMVATIESAQGRAPTPALLLVAFQTSRQRLYSMAVLGALYAGCFLVVLGLSSLVDGGGFAKVYLGFEPMTPKILEDPGFQGAMWLSMALYVPLSLLFWHAPGLVHWHGVPPIKSLFFSIVACLRNWGAFMVYGLGWTGVFMLAGMVVALVTVLLSTLIGQAAAALMMGMAMVLASMMFTSVVFTFRDCFGPPETPPGAAPPDATPPAAPPPTA